MLTEKKQSKAAKFKGTFKSKFGFGGKHSTNDLFSAEKTKQSKKLNGTASSSSAVASVASLVGSTNSLNLKK